MGPAGFFESRTRKAVACRATSTQAPLLPLRVLFRQVSTVNVIISIRVEFGRDAANHLPRLSLAQRGRRERGQDVPIGLDLIWLLEEQTGGLALQVGDRPELGELHQPERA